MYPLLPCSIISLMVIIERLLSWAREDMRRNRALVDEILELCRVGDWEGVKIKAAGSKDHVIKILISGIFHREFSMTKAIETTSADEIKRMSRYLGVLDTMITVAPLLGIFGTVIGIITSFEILGSSGIEHPHAVTDRIPQAFIITATGLGIALQYYKWGKAPKFHSLSVTSRLHSSRS